MAYINPFIKVNQGGIPRLEARNVPTATNNNLTYDFYPHRFLDYPYAGLIIFKLPAVTAPTTAGNVYFTSGGSNSTQVFNRNGVAVPSNSANLVGGGVFIGWYSEGKLLILNV